MAEQPKFRLYSYWRTSATYRVRVALALKGIAAQEVDVDIDGGEHRSPEFLKINPLGAIPALVEEGEAPLTQSIAILEYLDEIAPEPPLLPGDPRGRARVRSIAAMLASDTHPLITPRVRRYLAEAGFDQDRWRAWQVNWFTTGLQAVERKLTDETGAGSFCHGDAVTIADVCLASVTAVMKVFGITVADVPTVDRIVAACEAMPAFANADPMKQTGAPKR